MLKVDFTKWVIPERLRDYFKKIAEMMSSACILIGWKESCKPIRFPQKRPNAKTPKPHEGELFN